MAASMALYSGLDAGLALAPVAFGMLLDRNLHSMVFIGVAMTLSCAILAALALGREVGERHIN